MRHGSYAASRGHQASEWWSWTQDLGIQVSEPAHFISAALKETTKGQVRQISRLMEVYKLILAILVWCVRSIKIIISSWVIGLNVSSPRWWHYSYNHSFIYSTNFRWTCLYVRYYSRHLRGNRKYLMGLYGACFLARGNRKYQIRNITNDLVFGKCNGGKIELGKRNWQFIPEGRQFQQWREWTI